MTDSKKRMRTDDTASADRVIDVAIIERDESAPSSRNPRRERMGGEVRVSAVATNSVTIYYDAADVERRKTIYRLNRQRRGSKE